MTRLRRTRSLRLLAGAAAMRAGRVAALHALGHLAQRQLAQVGQVLLLEEILQRPRDLVRRVDLPGPQPLLQILDRRSRFTTWSACLRKLSGTVSRTATPVTRSTRSFRLSRCCTLKRADDVDPGVQQLLHVLVALLVAAARDVGVGELVDDGHRRLALQHGVEVHLLDGRRRGTRPARRGTTSSPSTSAAVSARPCVSTKPSTTSTPRLPAGRAPPPASGRSCPRPRRSRCRA